jgi:hypothetical protein
LPDPDGPSMASRNFALRRSAVRKIVMVASS